MAEVASHFAFSTRHFFLVKIIAFNLLFLLMFASHLNEKNQLLFLFAPKPKKGKSTIFIRTNSSILPENALQRRTILDQNIISVQWNM